MGSLGTLLRVDGKFEFCGGEGGAFPLKFQKWVGRRLKSSGLVLMNSDG